MALFNYEHLFQQAELLSRPARGGAPRQVDLRRAISSAYYGVFHYTLTAATDELVGVTRRGSGRYALVYRSVDHRALRALCVEATKAQLTVKYRKHASANGFGPAIQAFANGVVELQEMRHSADYDPAASFGSADARFAIASARRAIARFARVSPVERRIFLTLLLFPPR